MDKNQISCEVGWILLKFWWMIPLAVKSHKDSARKSTVVARDGRRKWRTQVSKSVKSGHKMLFWVQSGYLGCPWRGPFVLQPI